MLFNQAQNQSTTTATIAARVLIRLSCFIVIEFWLNAVNLDTLADYHEFMQRQLAIEVTQQQTIAQNSFNATPVLVS
ncbi:hypothetical protein IQ266_27460 [filamentous cyanobacterium LEGE 11480]|uniref:Uncharacterized protein n=1 Tax=Romeriopsis navalis LEGE 11480 TaxID=2777977 RepID=A0A928VWT3_9CYAN|nr:hypothetical protein [Romeriopsis navalis]MBE9033474.1 hypothetical protein [Romeriopsis navalis LEGE 11480]